MLNSLLANFWENYGMIIVIILFIVVIVVFYILSSRKRKKQEQEAKDLIDAVKPGNKVKTIGGICGIVVEVDAEENTFVLETGTELSGKSYIKFDRQAIYQTDAVVEKQAPATESAESVESAAKTDKEKQNAAAENTAEDVFVGAVNEKSVDEKNSEEKSADDALEEKFKSK